MSTDPTDYTLVGRNASPFTRRVAIAMQLMGLQPKRERVSPLTHPERVRPWHPVGRVPVLVLPDAARLIESSMILDYLLECHDLDGRLLPKTGLVRRQRLQTIAHALTVMEKTVLAAYERIKRPETLWHPPVREAYVDQVRIALQLLEVEQGGRPAYRSADWAPDLADVTVAVAFGFVGHFQPDIIDGQALPMISGLLDACEAHPAFRDNQPETP